MYVCLKMAIYIAPSWTTWRR